MIKTTYHVLPLEKKPFIFCDRGIQPVMFEKHFRTVFNFIRFVKAGPPCANSQSQDCIKYYIAHASHFLCQHALCVHSVMTFTTGPSLVLG